MATYSSIPVVGTAFSSDSRTGGSVPAKFDAYLYKPDASFNQLKLSIKLKINLRQMPPRAIPTLDASGDPFWTTSWTPSEWQYFVAGAFMQMNMWNNKLWLVPPATFTDFDLSIHSSPGQVWRPNIRCVLDVESTAAKDAHRIIDVANVNLALMSGKPKNSKTVRSHSMLYDSLDTVPWFSHTDGISWTIAHEIGHAIGLGHIGTILKTPLCMLAIEQNQMGLDHHPLTQGGTASLYCYGEGQGYAISANIMGGGSLFSAENALPWIWAMKMLRGRAGAGEHWRAVTTDPGPGSWSKKS
jgi:hypothetical protein